MTWNLIETVLCVKTWKWGMGAENANFNEFKSNKLLWSSSSWYIFLLTHANCKNVGTVWQFGLCNRGQLGRIYALSLYPLLWGRKGIESASPLNSLTQFTRVSLCSPEACFGYINKYRTHLAKSGLDMQYPIPIQNYVYLTFVNKFMFLILELRQCCIRTMFKVSKIHRFLTFFLGQ